jgi:hypothetical protein
MGRIARRGDQRRWHILDDWLGSPICGRVAEGEIVDGALYDDVPADALICRHCHRDFSWQPMPHDTEQVDRGYTTPCLIWKRGLHGSGYGQRKHAGQYRRTHREAYEAAYGPIPAGHILHHLCEQRDCLEPTHLEAMSRADHARLHFGQLQRGAGGEFLPIDRRTK